MLELVLRLRLRAIIRNAGMGHRDAHVKNRSLFSYFCPYFPHFALLCVSMYCVDVLHVSIKCIDCNHTYKESFLVSFNVRNSKKLDTNINMMLNELGLSLYPLDFFELFDSKLDISSEE